MSRKPLVPTLFWKNGLIAVYKPILDKLGASPESVSTVNDGSIFVLVDATVDDIETAGAFPMSEEPTQKGWHIVCDEGMQYAAQNHPSEGKVVRETAKKELTPEQAAREERRKELREKMQSIKSAQKDES